MIKPISLLLQGITSVPKWGTLDLMEYPDNATAQAAYVTNATLTYGSNIFTGGTPYADQSYAPSSAALCFDNRWATDDAAWQTNGNFWNGYTSGILKYDLGAGITKIVAKYTINCGYVVGQYNPTAWTFEGSNNDSDWTTLDTRSGISWASYEVKSFTFSNSTAYRYYRFYFTAVDGASSCIIYELQSFEAIYSLQSYSESTIKTQGSYSLKAIASTSALNKTLTRTISSPIDLSGQTKWKFDIRSNRTGSNVKVGLHNARYLSNADIDDEDMAVITDWTDADAVTGDSSQATFDGKSCMKLDTGSTVLNSQTIRRQDVGTFGTRTVFSFSLYCETLGTAASEDRFNFGAFDGTTKLNTRFSSDGLYIYDGAAWNEAGTNLVVVDTWQEWTFDVDWTAKTVDIYVDGVLGAADVDCSQANATANGTVEFLTSSVVVANILAYIDWFKAGSDFAAVLTETTPNIASADTFQTVEVDISGVADADKNAIDRIIITPTNADSANTVYLDYLRYR